MHSLNSLQKKLNEAFGSLRFNGQPAELYEPVKYTLQLGGKRIRPLLVLLGCDLFGGDPEKAIPAAIGIELFHNFTLLHDDIMDQALLRRGKETVYKKWNSNVAILSGDTLFALAYESLLKADPAIYPDLLPLFTETAKQVCEGQQYDMNFEKKELVTIPEYLEMIRLKTAVLLACSLCSGAIVAGAAPEGARMLYSAGENLGMAFQLQDDLLDIYGTEEKFGKEIGGDIVSNKKTFPFLTALHGSGEKERTALQECFRDLSIAPSEKIRRVKEIYDLLNVREITLKKISEYFGYATELLESIQVPAGNKKGLLELANQLIKRDF